MPAARVSGASVRCFGTNGWQSRRLWQKRRHTSRGQKNATAIMEGVVQVTHEAPYGRQKTPPSGMRPGSLAEPEPQRSDRSLRHSSGDAHPTLGLLVLAGASGEAVDGAALSFLTAPALDAKRKEELKAAKRQQRVQEVPVDEWRSNVDPDTGETFCWNYPTRETRWSLPVGASSKRKKKKRKPRRRRCLLSFSS